MTKHELQGIGLTEKEAEYLSRRIRRLEDELMRITALIDGMPRAKNKPCEIREELMDLRRLLSEKRLEIISKRICAEKYIQSINDPLLRLVLGYRYIDRLTWSQVARRIGSGTTRDACRKMVERFFKKN